MAQLEEALARREKELTMATTAATKRERDIEVQRLEQRLQVDEERARYKEAVEDANRSVVDEMKALLDERDAEAAETPETPETPEFPIRSPSPPTPRIQCRGHGDDFNASG